MKLKPLLIASAVVELGAGLAIAVAPSVAISILFGTGLDSPTGLAIARLLGAALLTLGIACWLARLDEQSQAAHGVVAAMTVYNIGAVAVLAHAGMSGAAKGPVLWAAVLTHVAMAAWCIAVLSQRRRAS